MKDKNRDIVFDTFFETSCPMILIDRNGFPIVWNNAVDRFIMRNSNKLDISCGHNFWNTIKQILLPEETEHLNAFIRGEKEYWEAEIKYKPLHKKVLWYRLEAFHAEQSGTVFCCLHDNTNRHIHEMQLLAEKQNAERATFTKSQFLATMSHEIRTPIQTIIGTADLLSETALDDEQNEYTQQIKFSADVLLSIINNILDISKIEAGQFVLEETPFELETQIEKVLDLVALEAHKKHLELLLDYSRSLPKVIIGDPWRLNQILLNLLKNAVKFTDEGGVTLHVFPIQKDETLFVEFRVTDTGIGISEEQKQRLFTPFYQGGIAATRKFGGTGLGLAICKNIVEMMNGTIGCYANAQKGSTFRFSLPVYHVQQPPDPPFIPQNRDIRVLVVDDNPEACRILKKQLHRLCLKNAEMVSSGEAALSLLKRAAAEGNPFKAVMIDMIMPDMNGWRLAMEIKKDKDISSMRLYLVMQDGLVRKAVKEKIPEWFDGFLYKPLKYRQLLELVKEMDRGIFSLNNRDKTGNAPQSLLKTAQRIKQQTGTAPSAGPQKTAVPVAAESAAAGNFAISALIAEDHPVNRKLLKTMLIKSGAATIYEAENGREAVHTMENVVPDIIFMDLQMPEMNGYEASIQIRKNGYSGPIIACTANAGADEESRCHDCGMDDIITKPFKRKDVTDIIEKWIPA